MQITLVLTHQCNLACDYCYAGEKFARSMRYQTGARALAMAFATAAPGEAMTVGFFGGEPMLEFPLLVRLTRLAHRLARRQRRLLQFTITTNGTVLSEKHLRFLYTYGFDTAISVDGLGEGNRHRPFATGKASTEIVWGNIAAAAQVLDRLHVLMVVGPDSLGDLERSVQRLYQLGVPTMSLLPNVDVEWTAADWERTQQVFTSLAQACRNLLDQRPLVLHPFIDRLQPTLSGTRCGFGDTEVAVSPRGHLYPCARLVGTDVRRDIRIGNIRDGIDLSRVAAVQARSQETMSNCGVDGPCGCVPLMPGTAVADQLERYRRFGMTIEQSLGEGVSA